MSTSLVLLIGVIYLLAAGSCLIEGRVAYMFLNLFWGGGNVVIAYLMSQ